MGRSRPGLILAALALMGAAQPPDPRVAQQEAASRLVATFLDQLAHDLRAARAVVDRHITLVMGGTTGRSWLSA